MVNNQDTSLELCRGRLSVFLTPTVLARESWGSVSQGAVTSCDSNAFCWNLSGRPCLTTALLGTSWLALLPRCSLGVPCPQSRAQCLEKHHSRFSSLLITLPSLYRQCTCITISEWHLSSQHHSLQCASIAVMWKHRKTPWQPTKLCFMCSLFPCHRFAFRQSILWTFLSTHKNVWSQGHASNLWRLTEGYRNFCYILWLFLAFYSFSLLFNSLSFYFLVSSSISCPSSCANISPLVTSLEAPTRHPQPCPGQVCC